MRRGAFALVAAGYAVLIGVWYLLGRLVESVAERDGGAWFDSSVSRWAIERRTPWLVDLMRILTEMGGTIFVGSALILTAILLARRTPGSGAAMFPLVTLVGALTLSRIVKSLVDRLRPDDPATTTFIDGSAFPSGHATAAAAMFSALALIALRELGRREGRWVAAGSVALALLVAFSRVYLGVHWATDVIAGLALGTIWTLLARVATSRVPDSSTT